jgi:bifunctional DNA-binding transcriptional regulator/antitoxin component of YhaV-PrlF toxin-antitoxin module
MTVTLKDTLQILVPQSLQRQAGFKLGDQLELRASRGVIMIVPKPQQPSPFMSALRATQEEAKANGLDKLTMKQVNAQVAAYRKEKRQKATKPKAK